MVGGILRIIDTNSMAGTDPRQPGAVRWYYQMTWGTVSRRPEMTMRVKDKKPYIKFSVCWRRNQYVNYICFSDNPFAYEIAQRLRIGDPVVVWSHGSEREYTPKKGKNAGRQRMSRDSKAHIIFPARLFAGILVAMQDAAETPDILEGLEEYLKQSMEDTSETDYQMPF